MERTQQGEQPPYSQPKVCQNCGTPLHGRYCSACGQDSSPKATSFKYFIGHLLEELVGLNSKMGRTLRNLPIPGKLATDWFDGKRVCYFSPMRLYVVSSLTFFLLMGLLGDGEVIGVNNPTQVTEEGERVPLSESLRDSLRQVQLRVQGQDGQDTVVTTEADGLTARLLLMDPEARNQRMREMMPTALLIMVPLFGLVVWGLFWKKRPGYMPALVISLHLFSVFFLLSSLRYLVVRALDIKTDASNLQSLNVVIIILLVFAYLSLHRFYRTSLLGAFWRFFVVVNLFSLMLAGVLFGMVVITAYF